MEIQEKTFLRSYEAYSDEIFRFVLFRLSDREKAKDIVQDVFMKTWVFVSRGGKIDNMRAFLYRTAGNTVIDEYRRQNRTENKNESLDTLSEETGYDPGFDDTDVLIDKLDGKQALELIKGLPETYSEVLFLRYVESRSVPEIAEIVGRPDNTVSVQLNRGLKKLKETINQKFKDTL